jgi:endonuclease YncB( thermonuclease family)
LTDRIRLGTESRNGVNQKQGPGIVPLDRKRRIFRPPTLSLPRGGPSMPNRATAVAVLGCVAILSAGVWLLGRPSEAPANAPETGVLAATAPGVAVLDGSTLRLGDRVVRLDGLSAPERGELCPGAGPAETDCGVAAANALAALVRDTRVECNWRGRDPVGRPLAVCSARGIDVNQALVRAGWARAGAGHPGMVAAEQQAKAARRGLWARG